MPSAPGAPSDLYFERDSTFKNLEEVVEAAQGFAARVFGEEKPAHRFVLAVSEAVTNAIEHGNASDPQKQFTVALRLVEECAEATVTDQGGGFDPSAVASPLDEENLTRSHGRGLHIITQMADEVQYEDEGRSVRMSFLLPA